MRALIVDDSPTAREQAVSALEDALEAMGLACELEVAESGVEALRILASVDVGLLVLDLHMPDIHGLDVLSFWRQRSASRTGRALVISTQVSSRDREKALSSGAHRFLEKPVSAAALQEALEGFPGTAP